MLLDGLTSPANIGGIFRLSDAFGVEQILLSNCDFQPQSVRFKRTARHTETLVPYSIIEDPVAFLQQQKQRNYQIISLEITDNSQPLHQLEIKSTQNIVLIVGSERHGVSEELLKHSNLATHISMFGKNSSMNVTQALGVALFQITKTLTH